MTPWTLFPDSPTPTTVYTQPSRPGRLRWRVYVPGGVPLGRILIGTGEGRESEVKASAWRAYRRSRDLLVWRARPFDGEVEARLHELDAVCTVRNTSTRSTWTVAVDGEVIAEGVVVAQVGSAGDADASTKRRQTQAQDECARIVRGLLP